MVLLWVRPVVNRIANRWLALALMTTVLLIIRGFLTKMQLSYSYSLIDFIPLQFSLALGPIIYWYVRKTSNPTFTLKWTDTLHFGPAFLEQLLFFAEVSECLITKKHTYQTSFYKELSPVISVAAYLSVLTYLYLSYRGIRKHYQTMIFDGWGDRYRTQYRSLEISVKLCWFFCFLLISLAVVDHEDYQHVTDLLSGEPVYVLTAILLIRMAAAAVLTSAEVVEKETISFAKRTTLELKEQGRWLKQMMAAKRHYLEPNLTLGSLAEKLDIHPHELSRIINDALKKNFNDFINEYRIREVTDKMLDPGNDRLTLLGIAFDSGFNSKSTFNRVFKEITGKSPAVYKKEQIKDSPTYHLRRQSRPAGIVSYLDTGPKWPAEKLRRNDMFKSYLKIAWRNLVHQKLYSFINISGLGIALAVCMLIMLYVVHEHSYDRFHSHAERIYRPFAHTTVNGVSINMDHMSFASAPIIKQSQPAVEGYMRTLRYFMPAIVVNPEKPQQKFSEGNLLFADSGFFQFFSFRLIQGQASKVLSAPYAVVISEEMAKKYFAGEDPVGKRLTIKTDTMHTYQVTGVAENCPSNSSIKFDFVSANSSFVNSKTAERFVGEQKVGGGAFDVYLLLKNRADTAALKRSLATFDPGDDRDAKIKLSVFPFLDQHLKRTTDNSNSKYLTIFPLVAILILLLALFNYISLTTARATLRSKEIGVRKISGASRKGIALQFYLESALALTISFALGCLLCYFFKPVLANILQQPLEGTFFFQPSVLCALLASLVLVIILAGCYPSLVLSGFNPAITLKGKMSKQTGGVIIRKVFTTLQFSISVGLIICGIVIDRQLYFFRHTDTGISRDNVIMIPVAGSVQNYSSFKQDVAGLPAISDVATSEYEMFTYYDRIGISTGPAEENTMLQGLTVDKKLIGLLGLKWKLPPVNDGQLDAGSKVVINESAIKKLHLKSNPIGSFINPGPEKIEVAGVVKDFGFGSLENDVQPLGLFIAADTAQAWNRGSGKRFLFAKVKPDTNLPTLIHSLEAIYKNYDNDSAFSYRFMDDAFNAQYKAEDKLASIFGIFIFITVMLAAMGLFGLAAFTLEQRTKELGIRKVLGASNFSINRLLSADFLKLVMLSILIASPVAGWAMHLWLRGFAHRISIQWWMFGLAGLLAVIVAIATISYHTIRAAVTNPVKSLRSE